MKTFILFIFLSGLILTLKGQHKIEKIYLKVVAIKKLSRGDIYLTAINSSINDTVRIISYNSNFYKENGTNKLRKKQVHRIVANSTYQFSLIRAAQFSVDFLSHENLIIIGKDTVWRSHKVDDAPYYSINSRGFLINERLKK